MDKDIVPELLGKIKKDYNASVGRNKTLQRLIKLQSEGKATYKEVNEFSIELGKVLSNTLQKHITGDVLPDGKMYYNIANRILNEMMPLNHEKVSGYGAKVQKDMNEQAKIGIRAQTPELNQDRIDGIVNRVSYEDSFEGIKWILDDPMVTFTQSVVDDMIEANVEFQAKSGLRPKIIRKASGHCCDWCQALVGSFEYGEEPKDVYRRHGNCRCTVNYHPTKGNAQDVWGKGKTRSKKNESKEERVERITHDVAVKQIKERMNKIDLTTATPNDIIKLGKEINDQFNVDKHIGDKEKLKEIFSNFRDIGGTVPKESWAKGSNRAVKSQLEEAFSNYPKEWANIPSKNNKQLLARKNNRGFFAEGAITNSGKYYDTKYDNFKDGYYTITTNGERKTTPYHEIGHMVEANNSDIVRIEKEWVDKRTKDEEYSRLRDIFPGTGYTANEVVKKDDFVDPYIGKYYENNTEVLSMGLQGIFEPEETFKKSRDHKTGEYEEKTISDDKDFLHLTIGLLTKG